MRRVLANIVAVEKQRVFLIQKVMRMRHIVICGLPDSTAFFRTLSNKWQDFLKKEKCY